MTRDIQRLTTVVLGALLTVLGLVGFVSGTQLFGLGANPLHNVVHLLTGVLGLVAVWQGWSQAYNRGAGIFFLLLAVLGFIAFGFTAELLNANTAAHIFHLVLGAVLAALGFAPSILRRRRATV